MQSARLASGEVRENAVGCDIARGCADRARELCTRRAQAHTRSARAKLLGETVRWRSLASKGSRLEDFFDLKSQE